MSILLMISIAYGIFGIVVFAGAMPMLVEFFEDKKINSVQKYFIASLFGPIVWIGMIIFLIYNILGKLQRR